MKTYDEFWLFYLKSHASPITRRIHYLAISVIALGLALAAYTMNPWVAAGAIAAGYVIAWTAHFTVEQ